MANSSSARKRVRSSARKHERNRRVRSAVRTAVTKARREIKGGESELAGRLVLVAASALDKAAQHGVIHARNAARRKSRLMRQAARGVAAETAGGTRRATAQGTKPKSTAASRRGSTAARSGRPATKTERTAASQRRSAVTAGQEPKAKA